MSDIILGAIIGTLGSLAITMIGKIMDKRSTNAGAGKYESATALDLQEIAASAVREQNKLRKEIEELRRAKQADYDLHVIFTLGPPPSVRKVTLKAVDPVP